MQVWKIYRLNQFCLGSTYFDQEKDIAKAAHFFWSAGIFPRLPIDLSTVPLSFQVSHNEGTYAKYVEDSAEDILLMETIFEAPKFFYQFSNATKLTVARSEIFICRMKAQSALYWAKTQYDLMIIFNLHKIKFMQSFTYPISGAYMVNYSFV